MQQAKRVSDSRTEQVQIILPAHANGNYRLFGGQLVQWIDIVAAVVARRQSGCEVITASIDNLSFRKAAYVNSTIVLRGCITYVGNTSMEVRVDTYVEEVTGETDRINRAYFTMVALDEFGRPVTVPRLILETDEERREWAAGERRSALRHERKAQGY